MGNPAPERRSRISDDGSWLLYADLHNHSMLSDGAGDPDQAFAMMRAAGLDVAALTDHASIPHDRFHEVEPGDYPDRAAYELALTAPHSLDAAGWCRTAELADAADEPGAFTAIRGFEWTEPWLGHANVWFSDDYLHVETYGRVEGLHFWLTESEQDALLGYNHPGREPGRFHNFELSPALAQRMVSLEVFNRFDDYLFEGWSRGRPSPIAACLDAGWRPALTGVSDEHSQHYGVTGKGRTGLWVRDHSRAGVREALLARRCFATRERALRLDATLGGVRMGGELAGTGVLELVVDVEDGDLRGRPVQLQLLGPGREAPEVLAVETARSGGVARCMVETETAPWLLLRVADPERANASPGPQGHPGNAFALAYAAPWFRPLS